MQSARSIKNSSQYNFSNTHKIKIIKFSNISMSETLLYIHNHFQKYFEVTVTSFTSKNTCLKYTDREIFFFLNISVFWWHVFKDRVIIKY